jgi:DNA end-binding protein Ku
LATPCFFRTELHDWPWPWQMCTPLALSCSMATTKKRTRKTTRKKSTAKKSSSRTGARAMWKGELTIGRTKVPVKMYAAVQDQGVHFRLLHETDKQPLRQHMVNPETDEVIEHAQIKKGYVDDGGVVVMLDDEELDELKPEPSREIEITRFVPRTAISHGWYDRPYWLGPDGNSNGSYFALAEALEAEEKEGIAKWVMRGKEYVGALVGEDGYLMLITLRHAGEVVESKDLPRPAGRTLDRKEVALAGQLVSALEGPWNPAEFQDEYRDRLMDFIKSKAKGRAPKVRKLRPKPETKKSLADVLQASLKTAEKERKSA